MEKTRREMLIEKHVRLRRIEELNSIKSEVEQRVREIATGILEKEKQKEGLAHLNLDINKDANYRQLIEHLNYLSVD